MPVSLSATLRAATDNFPDLGLRRLRVAEQTVQDGP
jgi:hypothetical protein